MYTILIVDDSQFMRSMIKSYLNRAGYIDILESPNGIDAIEKYKKYHPDLVIMDITMNKMDGVETLNRIKQIDNDSKVIMCQAMGQEQFILKAINFGANDFIVKPFTYERIISQVRKIIPL